MVHNRSFLYRVTQQAPPKAHPLSAKYDAQSTDGHESSLDKPPLLSSLSILLWLHGGLAREPVFWKVMNNENRRVSGISVLVSDCGDRALFVIRIRRFSVKTHLLLLNISPINNRRVLSNRKRARNLGRVAYSRMVFSCGAETEVTLFYTKNENLVNYRHLTEFPFLHLHYLKTCLFLSILLQNSFFFPKFAFYIALKYWQKIFFTAR